MRVRPPLRLLVPALAAVLAAATPFRRGAAQSTGVPADTGGPAVTLLYQNFPNPFPTADSRTTCIWFDLNRPAAVTLTVHDVRGNLVRRLLPNASSPPLLEPGRYGRATPTANEGCDPATTWDGHADDGSTVPRGVYIIRLQAGNERSIKKAIFRGP